MLSASVTEEGNIPELQEMLRGKNCIVIAPPDVNPLTKVAARERTELHFCESHAREHLTGDGTT